MKHVLLTALSLLVASNCPVFAQQNDRSSAGAATPVKLGGDTRSKPAAARNTSSSQSSQAQAKSTASTSSAAAPGTATTGSAATGTTQVPSTQVPGGKKTASAAKGLIPPPPAMQLPLGAATDKTKKTKAPKAAKKEDKTVVVGRGGPFTFTGKSQEQYSATFNWQPDDARDSITFKANFSPVGQPGQSGPHFNWLRIKLGSQVLATEQTLKGKSFWIQDMTGAIPNGINQIVVSGQALAGSTFDWKMTTPRKVKLTAVNPDEVVVGEDLTLKGENFDPTPAKDTVGLGRKNLLATAATATELKVKIPKDFTPGDYMVKVTVDGLTSKEKKVTVRGIPELSGTNFQGVPPGAELTIFGKNFSKKANENQVIFDATPAQVVSCTTEQIVVVVPNFYNEMSGDTGRIAGQVGIPIKVKVGKIESKNTVPINVGNSLWQDPGLKGGPDVPQVPVDWRRLLEN